MKNILITNSLANDMAQPIGRNESLPHVLHIGHYETLRLLGTDWQSGPLIQFLRQCEDTPKSNLSIIHIRDWHTKGNPDEQAELSQFGEHCMAGTHGAKFIWEDADILGKGINKPYIINSTSLLAASEREFMTLLDEIVGATAREEVNIGLAGLLTNMKVMQMAISLKSYSHFNNVAVCAALSASNIRRKHFDSLDDMHHQYGIRIIGGISEFSDYLSLDQQSLEVDSASQTTASKISNIKVSTFAPKIIHAQEISESKLRVVEHLYKECSAVTLDRLSGGFSGAEVFLAQGEEGGNVKQVPMIIKLDTRERISKERMGFEKVQYVLGPHVPTLQSYYESDEGAGIRYSFAMMNTRDKPVEFKRFFMRLDGNNPQDMEKLDQSLELLFEEILRPMASGYNVEATQLWQANTFNEAYAAHTINRIKELGHNPASEKITIAGCLFDNPARFYNPKNINAKLREPHVYVRKSLAQGDLNLANLLIDLKLNEWMIDFFHTGYGWHNIQDVVKMENDIKYIHTPIRDESELSQALILENILMHQEKLSDPLANLPESVPNNPNIVRAYHAIKALRKFAFEISSDEEMKHYRIPQLRYAAHNLSFPESTTFQKQWAIAGVAMLCQYLKR